MRKSFYSWLMTERNPKSKEPKAILADLDEVSRFLEEHANFSFNLGECDAIWEEYQAH